MGLLVAWLARVLGGGGGGDSTLWWELPAWPTPSGSTIQVTDDAGFTSALSTLSATGGIIELDPAGTYAARTFGSNPSAMIYIVSASSSNKATIASVTLNAEINNLTFKWIKFGGSDSDGDLVSGRSSAPYPSFMAYGCEFTGIDIDPYHYPIYLNVASTASFVVGEVVTGATSGSIATIKKITSATRMYVHITTRGSGGGATQANPYLASETVTGSIAGSSTMAASTQLTRFTPYGVRFSFKDVKVQGCTFSNLSRGIQCSAVVAGGEVAIHDNSFDKNYEMGICLNAGALASSVVMAFNRITRAIGSNLDFQNPHCDAMAITAPPDTSWSNLYLYANTLVNGFSRGFMFGIPFHSDLVTAFYSEKCVGNVGAWYTTAGSTQGFTIDRAKDCYIFGNIVARQTPGSGTGNISRIFTAESTGNVDKYNTYELGGGYKDTDGNINLSNNDAYYETVYDGAFPLVAANHTDALVEIQTRMKPKSTSGISIIRDYVDWTNKRINQSIEPALFNFTAMIDQATSSTVTSGWRRNWTAGTRSVSITNGEYQIANDSSGTGASGWTSAAGTITEGKWIQVRCTSSGSAATATQVTLTVGGENSTFTVITAAAQTYTAIDNGGAVYSSLPTLNGGNTTYTKALIALRFRLDVAVTSGVVFSDDNLQFRLFTPAAGNLRLLLDNTNIRIDLNSIITAPSAMQTHIIAVDLTKPSVAGGGVIWTVDGTQRTTTTNTWPTTIPSTASIYQNRFGLFDQYAGAGAALNGAMEFFWMDWGDATYQLPDITDPAVFAKFYKDLIGADGSGPTGSQPKLCYYGSLSDWNGGLANKGSLTATLTNTGGSYT